MRKQVNTYLSLVFTVMLAALLFVSCQKEDEVKNDIDQDSNVKALAKAYVNTMTQEQFKEWNEKYQKLSFEEMEQFNEYAAQFAFELVKDKEENAAEKIQFAKEMRNELNRTAMKQYGLPYNRIEIKQLNSLSQDLWEKKYLPISKEKFGPSTANAKTSAACGCVKWTKIVSIGWPGWSTNGVSTIRTANHPNCNDCDLEIFYSKANASQLSAISGAGLAYIAYTNGMITYRNHPGKTSALFGYGAVNTVFLGSEWLAQISCRMD